MLPKINPANTTAWRSLQEHFSEMKNVHMRELFKQDPDRFSKYSISNRDIVFDYSKNIINDKTIQLLLQLANECKLKDGIDAMFNGEKINETEGQGSSSYGIKKFFYRTCVCRRQRCDAGSKKSIKANEKFLQSCS